MRSKRPIVRPPLTISFFIVCVCSGVYEPLSLLPNRGGFEREQRRENRTDYGEMKECRAAPQTAMPGILPQPFDADGRRPTFVC